MTAKEKKDMELLISIDNNKSVQPLDLLNQNIKRAAIDGVISSISNQQTGKQGEMGVALLSSITAIVHAAREPLIALIKCLQQHIDNYRTSFTVTTKKGKQIKIEHGRSMSAEELERIIKALLDSE